MLVFLFAGMAFSSDNVNYSLKVFTTANGLPHNNVRSIVQDKAGFLWIATWDGLSRYDGYEFRNYQHSPDDSTTIPYFTADEVVIDRHDNLWVVGYPVGLSRYNPERDNFIRVFNHDVKHITLDPDGNLWIFHNDRLKKWNNEQGVFEIYALWFGQESTPIQTEFFSRFEFDNEGILHLFNSLSNDDIEVYRAVSIADGGILFDLQGKISHKYIISYYSLFVFYLPVITSTGETWLFNSYHTFLLDRKTGQYEPAGRPFPKDELSGLPERVRIRIQNAIHWSGYAFSDRIKEGKNEQRFASSCFVDRQGIAWLGFFSGPSAYGGLMRCIPVPTWFKHYFFDQNMGDELNAFFPILKDRFGTLWAPPRNRNAMYRIFSDGSFHNGALTEKYDHTSVPRSLLEDSSGVWIGFNNDLLLFYDFKEAGYREVYNHTNRNAFDTLRPTQAGHLARDGNDLLIFGYSSIFRHNPRNGNFKFLYSSEYGRAIYSILKDSDQGWFTGHGGGVIKRFDRNFNLLTEIQVKNGRFNIESLCRGDQGELWAALLGGGITRIDLTTGKQETLTTTNGLSNNTAYSILKDKRGNLWITTNQGLSRYNPETRQFRIFDKTDGLLIEEFNSDGFFLAPDGEMYFAGMGGVVSFYPDSINLSKEFYHQTPLLVTEIKVEGFPRRFQKPVYEMDTLILQQGDDNFQVSFACPDFRDADKIKYRYRLAEKSKQFVETDHRNRFVNYAGLAPGTYRLEIEATNRDGDWVSGKPLVIIIPPFYYQTLLFKIIMVLLVFGSMIYMVFSHNRQIRLKALQQRSELRLESLRGQMNPHFIFNSLNSINYFISQNDRLSANRYIADFSRLIRAILENMTSDYITFNKELESLSDYLQLEHLRFADKFDFRIQVADELKTSNLYVVPGMVQPFVENAIWHGVRGLENRKGLVSVTFFLEGNSRISCVVEDNGIGRRLAEERKSTLFKRTSRGIRIIQERLEIFNTLKKTNYSIKVEDLFPDKEETGTRISIDIPAKT